MADFPATRGAPGGGDARKCTLSKPLRADMRNPQLFPNTHLNSKVANIIDINCCIYKYSTKMSTLVQYNCQYHHISTISVSVPTHSTSISIRGAQYPVSVQCSTSMQYPVQYQQSRIKSWRIIPRVQTCSKVDLYQNIFPIRW